MIVTKERGCIEMRKFWLCYMLIVSFALVVFYIATPHNLTASDFLLSSSEMQLLKGNTIEDYKQCESSSDNGCSPYDCSANTGYVQRNPYNVAKCAGGYPWDYWCEDDNPEHGTQKYCHIIKYESDCETVEEAYDTNTVACLDGRTTK